MACPFRSILRHARVGSSTNGGPILFEQLNQIARYFFVKRPAGVGRLDRHLSLSDDIAAVYAGVYVMDSRARRRPIQDRPDIGVPPAVVRKKRRVKVDA